MNKLIAFFPEVVYYCDCLQKVIEKCKRPSSLQDTCNEINDSDGEMIYCVKCGDDKKDVVFSCTKHLTMGTFAVEIHNNKVAVIQTETRQYCLSCVKTYLQEKYQIFNYEIFKNS